MSESRAGMKHFALSEPDDAAIRAAKFPCGCDKRVEHGVEVEGRAADDLQHIRRGGLLRQQFLEVARLSLHLFKQSRVLDSDDGLVGESPHQLDLPLTEDAGAAPPQGNSADDGLVAKQRHAEHGVMSGARPYLRVDLRVGANIGDILHFAGEQDARANRRPARRLGRCLYEANELLAIVRESLAVEGVADPLINEAAIGFAERDRRSNQGVQHCLQVERRTADDLQHIRRAGLLLQRTH